MKRQAATLSKVYAVYAVKKQNFLQASPLRRVI
jgi:hypothetical protein